MKNFAKNEAKGTYLGFLLPHYTYDATYKFLMCSTQKGGSFGSQFEVFHNYCALLRSFKRRWSPFSCQKKLKIMFCEICSTQNCCNWSWCGLFVLYSLISIIWYQNYIFPILHWNFTCQNRRKIRPKLRREVLKYLGFLLPYHTYNAAYKFPMCSTQWGGSFESQFEVFQEYCALSRSFKRHWSPFYASSIHN